MHVLITADTLGGVWVYARELVTGLVRRGVRITLVSFGGIPTREQSFWLRQLPDVDFRPTKFRLEWMQDSQADLENSAEYLCDVVREVNPELLHLNQYFYGSLPVDTPRLVLAHSDVLSWWAAVHQEKPHDGPWLRWYRDIVTRGLSAADAVVAPSQWMLDQVCAHYVQPGRASVIYNGRSPSAFSPNLSKEGYMVSVGRLWDSAKQVKLLTQCELPLSTVVAGSQVHPDEALRCAAPQTNGGRRVQFVGTKSQAELAHLLSRASIYAATSRYEPFGLAPVEAALSRCAIVANDIPSLREIWSDTVCYFERNDPESLAAMVTRLHGDRQLCREHADRAYERARAHFNAERMVDDYITLYGTLTSAEVAAA